MATQTGRHDFTDPGIWSGLRAMLDSTSVPAAPSSHWSAEYATLGTQELAKTEKFRRVIEMVPTGQRTLLDVGCNKGYCCELLRDRFDAIVGFDADEACIEVAHGAPGLNFCVFHLAHLEEKSVCERYAADVVLALAMTHHLDRAGWSPGRVASLLASLTKKYLLIEDIVHIGTYRTEFEKRGMKAVRVEPSYPNGRWLTLWQRGT